jgi:hypothetical protein
MSMTELDARLVLALRKPSPRFEKRRRWEAATIRNLRAMTRSLQVDTENGIVPLAVRNLPKRQAHALGVRWDRSPLPSAMPDFLVAIEGRFPVDLVKLAEHMEAQGVRLGPDAVRTLAASMVQSDLAKLAGDLVLAGALAFPGGLDPTGATYLVDGRHRGSHPFHPSDLWWACEEAAKLGWPSIQQLSFEKSLTWLRALPGFRDGVPHGTVGRAVSALSHLIGIQQSSSPGASLMWCMIGLEALYTRGKEGMSEQLYEKAQALLGSIKTHKKSFRGLYSYRSRFVHGDLDIPLAYTPYDGVQDLQKIEDEAYDAALLAAALLVATLQAMIKHNLSDLHFQWVLQKDR